MPKIPGGIPPDPSDKEASRHYRNGIKWGRLQERRELLEEQSQSRIDFAVGAFALASAYWVGRGFKWLCQRRDHIKNEGKGFGFDEW